MAPGCVFTFGTSEVAAYSKEGDYLFLEKMQMVVFVLGLQLRGSRKMSMLSLKLNRALIGMRVPTQKGRLLCNTNSREGDSASQHG